MYLDHAHLYMKISTITPSRDRESLRSLRPGTNRIRTEQTLVPTSLRGGLLGVPEVNSDRDRKGPRQKGRRARPGFTYLATSPFAAEPHAPQLASLRSHTGHAAALRSCCQGGEERRSPRIQTCPALCVRPPPAGVLGACRLECIR